MTISELRYDPITGRQVLIAEDRAGRPNDFAARDDFATHKSTTGDQADCPFCAGHENMTPAPLLEVAGADGKWQVRVVPNKFPAVVLGQENKQKNERPTEASPLGVVPLPPDGAHEVFIESPRHVQDLTELSIAELALLLQAYRERLRFWAADPRVCHATIFKNVGNAAGASLEHIHSQLVALPGLSPVMATELQGALRHYVENKTCVFCRLIDEERTQGKRLVADAGPFVAFCAYAGRQPYETWILPRKHAASFEQLSDADIGALAAMLQQIVRRLQSQLTPLSYNLILHTAPFHHSAAESDLGQYWHWHFELVPRSTELAGFEWCTGMHINPLSPERAAARLFVG